MPDGQREETSFLMSILWLTGESKKKRGRGVWLTKESNELELRRWRGRELSGYTRRGYRDVQAWSV